MKPDKAAIRKYNLQRQAAANVGLFTQYMEAGDPFSAYVCLGEAFQALNQFDPEQRQHYRNLIAAQRPSAEIVDALSPQYEHDYQRALQLVEYSPNLIGEEIDLIRQLRDNVFSVYNLLEQAFSISMTPLTELDTTIHMKLERYYRNRRKRG